MSEIIRYNIHVYVHSPHHKPLSGIMSAHAHYVMPMSYV